MNATLPLALAMLLNIWISVGWIIKKDYALAVVFLCYAIATAAFIYKGVTT